MANYYAFTKNGKPVLGSPIQGRKPRRGKVVPLNLGEELKVFVSVSFPNEGDSYEQVDSFRINAQVIDENGNFLFPFRLGYVYTGTLLTKESFLEKINSRFDKILKFKFIGEELFIVKSFIGKIDNAYINLILD